MSAPTTCWRREDETCGVDCVCIRLHPRLRVRKRIARDGFAQAGAGWSLFSFNVGVEIGQLAVVIGVAFLLAMPGLAASQQAAEWRSPARSLSGSRRLLVRTTSVLSSLSDGFGFMVSLLADFSINLEEASMKRGIMLGVVIGFGALSMAVAGFQNPPAGAGPGRGEGRGRGLPSAGRRDREGKRQPLHDHRRRR